MGRLESRKPLAAPTSLLDSTSSPRAASIPDPSVVSVNPATDRLGFSIAEVAQLLGCGEQTVSDAVACGDLPAWRLGRRVIIPRSALEFGPRVDLHVDTQLLADQMRLSALLAEHDQVELEIARVKNRLQERGVHAW
jgi:excisionase family DNA binding protein